MGRGERPLNLDDGRLTEFAADLRRLRVTAGGPPYRELARRAHYSATTLSDAAGGRRLPSLSVTLAYVAACGGDGDAWESRWRSLAAELAADAEDSAGGPEPTSSVAPYAGLSMFQAQDAGRFFGRDRLVAELADQVTRQRFVVVVGPSGSGKSSLLRAGLVHRARTTELCGGGPVVVLTPGPHPLEECAVHLATLTGTTPSDLHEALRTDPRSLHLSASQALVDAAPGSEVLVVVDQFEETFTLCRDAEERARFITLLRTAASTPNSRTRVVLGLRADFYAHCTHHPELVETLRSAQVLVGPMDAEELRSAITQPALDIGCRVETTLVAQVIAEATGRPGVLPLISHALLETWRRRRGTTLTLAGYDAAGGITQSIARTAETIYATLSPPERQWAREVFLRLVAFGEGTEDTKRRIDRAQLDLTEPGRSSVLERLARSRLVTLDRDTVEITHEALIQSWPRLHDWLTHDRESLLVHRRLTDAADAWQALERDPDALYRGVRLGQVSDQWASTNGNGTLSATEKDFLRASLAAQAHEQAAARRRTLRTRQLLALLSVLLVLTTTTTALALNAQKTVTVQRNVAIAQKVLSQAEDHRLTDPALAMQLTLAAHRLEPLPETRTALLNSFVTAPYVTRITEYSGELASLDFSPDGHFLVTTAEDTVAGTMVIWDVTRPNRPRELASRAISRNVVHAVLSPNGRTLAVARSDRITELWDLSEPRRPRKSGELLDDTGLLGAPAVVAFSPDGGRLVVTGITSDRHGAITLWDVGDPERPRELATRTGSFGWVHRVEFLPGSQVLVMASVAVDNPSASQLRLWDATDPADPHELTTLRGFTDTIRFAVSPDGRYLALAVRDTLSTWDVADVRDPRKLTTTPGPNGAVNDLRFSPDGQILATASTARSVLLWDVTDIRDPRPITDRMGFTAPVVSVAFSPDGRSLVTGDADHVLRLDHVSKYAYPVVEPVPINSVSLHPNGHTAATAHIDGTIELNDLLDLYETRLRTSFPTSPTKAPLITAVFSPDGGSIATTGTDGRLALWDIEEVYRSLAPTPILLDQGSPRDAAISLAFSPDGGVLAAGRPDGTTDLWNVRASPPRRLATVTRAKPAVTALAFHPTSRVLAATSADGTGHLWNVSDPANPFHVTTMPGDDIVSVAFSSDGRTMATANKEHGLRLWDVTDMSSPRVRATVNVTSFALSLAFSPDGRTLAAGKADASVELWDVTEPSAPQDPVTLMGPISGGGNGLGHVEFSSDNHTLVGSGRLNAPIPTMRVWETDTDHIVTRICDLAWPTITRAEWGRYFPGIPYRAPCPG